MEMETVTRMGVQIQDYSLALLLEKYARGEEATPEQVLDEMLGVIGAAVSGDRTLGGLCDFVEAQAPATDDVETAGARAGRWADASIVAVYGTPDPLN